MAPQGPAAAGGSSSALTPGFACTLHPRRPLSLCVSFAWMSLGVRWPGEERTAGAQTPPLTSGTFRPSGPSASATLARLFKDSSQLFSLGFTLPSLPEMHVPYSPLAHTAPPRPISSSSSLTPTVTWPTWAPGNRLHHWATTCTSSP